MAERPAWLGDLERRVGAGALACDAASLAAHARDGAVPLAVCAPESSEGVAAAVALCHAQQIPVYPHGNGTAPRLPAVPQHSNRPGLVLSTARLTRTFEHAAADIVATAGAGWELGAFQRRLGELGQWLPLGGPERATLGGLLATDRAGRLALGYGTLRDLVLGLTVVNGDGIARRSGGKVVKNVTGYALDKLYIGSHGTLGIITEATFKLRPLPPGRAAWALSAGSVARGIELLRGIARLNLPLETLRLRSTGVSDSELYVQAAGTGPELDRIHRELAGAAEREPQRSELPREWSPDSGAPAVDTLPQLGTPHACLLHCGCLPSQLSALAEQLGALPGRCEFTPAGAIAALGMNGSAAEELCAAVRASGATARIGAVWQTSVREPFGPPRPEWPLMRGLREQLDPRGICNPGAGLTPYW
jgi:glycolate oxidase FAD binding subunit